MMTRDETTTVRLLHTELGACALIQDLLPLYVEGEVSSGSRDLIVEHVARCERCAGYLAGTQAALTQLRRDQTVHTITLRRDEPNRQKVTAGQRLVATIAVLTTYAVGLAASLAMALAMFRNQDQGLPAFMFGSLIGSVCLLILFALARSYGALTLSRSIALLGSCATATFGSLFLVNLPMRSVGFMVALLLWSIGLVGVWLTIVTAQRPSATVTA